MASLPLVGLGRFFSGRPAENRHRPAEDAIDLSWVDEFIDNVRPYVFVRSEDNLLIKRPNLAQKLNAQGALLLGSLLEGESLHELLNRVGRHPRQLRDIELFLVEVKRFLEGRLDDTEPSSAIDIEPFDMHFSELPILSEVAITYRCNLRCSFCYAGCNCSSPLASSPISNKAIGDPEHEMTVAEIEEVLRRLFHDARVPSVSFTGGEPTLRSELPELVHFAKQLGMRVNLITNGTLMTEELATRLAQAGLDSAQVSLEGVTARTHEKITKGRGSFPRTVAAVGHLAKAGVLVHTNTTLNRDNLHESTEIPAFVKELGRDKFSMNLVVPTGTAAVDGELAVRYSKVGPHLERISAESDRVGVEFMWYSPVPMCMFNSVAQGLGNRGCSACDGLLSVAANGDVLPCASYDESVGNLLAEDARSVWRSKRARQFREKFQAHPACRDCPEFQICQGACPLYWRKMGFGELERLHGFETVSTDWFER